MVGFMGHNHIISSGTSVIVKKKNDNLVLIILFIIQEKTNSWTIYYPNLRKENWGSNKLNIMSKLNRAGEC